MLSKFYGLNEEEQRYRRRLVKENWDVVRDNVNRRSFLLNSSNKFKKLTPLCKIDESKKLLNGEEDDEKSIGEGEKVRENITTTIAVIVNDTQSTNNNSNNATTTATLLEWYELEQASKEGYGKNINKNKKWRESRYPMNGMY